MMKKEIKIKFVGFWPDFNEKQNFFTKILDKHYQVIISETPDYVFCSVAGEPYEECKYDAVRIHFNGENYTPDFNIHDYTISYCDLQFEDRHLQYPLYLVAEKPLSLVPQKHINVTSEILKSKPYFCNFVYGFSRDYREAAFEIFGKYKTVKSPGSRKNNMPDHPLVKSIEDKLNFLRKCKFTIAFDSTEMPGFVTEKIFHAFAGQTIPIYFGDPTINEHFNRKAFINVADYDFDLEKVLERIIEIDQDEELYLSILKEPVFINDQYLDKKKKQFEEFLVNIFDQDYDKAYRRSRVSSPKTHNDRLIEYNKFSKSKWNVFLRKFIN